MNQSETQSASHQQARRLFISGTDTDVGKTFVGCLLAEHFRYSGKQVGVYKPVASDCRTEGDEIIAEDAQSLWIAAGKPRTLKEVCPQKFFAPVAPPQAARAENKTVDQTQLVRGIDCWNDQSDVLIVEGAGGLFSPLADGFLNADLVKQLGPIDVLIIAANRLGTIHQTLATCIAAKSIGITPIGIVLSDVTKSLDQSTEENESEIAKYSDVPVLGRVGYDETHDQVAEWASRLL
ncbi:ATP-dependent dethiobiotin synthetase BioD 1 [Planctomycetes bacterium CA13]|uniref:ATP-dependent dethiobiotin synthetase BioD n=1 Tax=Novipirellula herctigrandis TaxID=2527986 RepID=A0A5C5Z5Q8_9BACT|nr:ATP-dependent dethiobiotin synthetase BioD 1 [Planctomycetes bacterium CA13]